MAICSEIHTKHINTLYGQNVELLNVKLVVHIITTGYTALCFLHFKAVRVLYDTVEANSAPSVASVDY